VETITRYLRVHKEGARWVELTKIGSNPPQEAMKLKRALDYMKKCKLIEGIAVIRGGRSTTIYTLSAPSSALKFFEEYWAFPIWLQSRIDKSGRPSPGLADDLEFAARWIAYDFLFWVGMASGIQDGPEREQYLKGICNTYLYTLMSDTVKTSTNFSGNINEAIGIAAEKINTGDLVQRALYESSPPNLFKDLGRGSGLE